MGDLAGVSIIGGWVGGWMGRTLESALSVAEGGEVAGGELLDCLGR